MAQLVKNPPAVWEILVRSLGWKDLLKKGTATYSIILARRFMDSYGPWGCKELEITERLSLGFICLFSLWFLLIWKTDLRKFFCSLCQRMFSFCSVLVLWCYVLYLGIKPFWVYECMWYGVHVCLVHMTRVSHVWLLMTPWTVALQGPLFVGFSRQEYWSG